VVHRLQIGIHIAGVSSIDEARIIDSCCGEKFALGIFVFKGEIENYFMLLVEIEILVL